MSCLFYYTHLYENNANFKFYLKSQLSLICKTNHMMLRLLGYSNELNMSSDILKKNLLFSNHKNKVLKPKRGYVRSISESNNRLQKSFFNIEKSNSLEIINKLYKSNSNRDVLIDNEEKLKPSSVVNLNSGNQLVKVKSIVGHIRKENIFLENEKNRIDEEIKILDNWLEKSKPNSISKDKILICKTVEDFENKNRRIIENKDNQNKKILKYPNLLFNMNIPLLNDVEQRVSLYLMFEVNYRQLCNYINLKNRYK